MKTKYPLFRIHYCGWDKDCRDLAAFTGWKNRRITIHGRYFGYAYIDWRHPSDRGHRLKLGGKV